MCFGWVGTSIPGLVSMPTIQRQLGHSLLRAQFLTFTFVFGAGRHFAGWRSTKMACSKFTAKRKVDSENRQFEEEWTEKFAFILPPTSTRPMCLICQETIAVMKISNLKWHYETKHRNFEETFPQNSGLTDLNKWTFESLKKISVAL